VRTVRAITWIVSQFTGQFEPLQYLIIALIHFYWWYTSIVRNMGTARSYVQLFADFSSNVRCHRSGRNCVYLREIGLAEERASVIDKHESSYKYILNACQWNIRLCHMSVTHANHRFSCECADENINNYMLVNMHFIYLEYLYLTAGATTFGVYLLNAYDAHIRQRSHMETETYLLSGYMY